MNAKSLVIAPRFYKQWMLLGNPAKFFDRIARDKGDFVLCKGLLEFYFVNDPELVKTVLRETNSRFDKNSALYSQFRKAFGTGLVIAEGKHWQRQRRLLQPHFSPAAVRASFGIMSDCVDQLVKRWEGYVKSDVTFNMVGEMHDLTLDIAGSTLLGGNFAAAKRDIARWTHHINVYSASLPLPVVSNLWFPTPKNLSLKRTLREFKVFISGVVEERKSGATEAVEAGLLNALLEAQDPETGERMSEDQLFAEILGVIIGGHETSSAALTWAWYELAKHPEVEKKLHAELGEVLKGERPALNHMPQLKYTRMVINETMRLHPPFWFENRNAMEDVEMWGVTIPKGSMVAFSRYSLHRHPEYWPEPERFIPERFAEDNTHTKHAYVPFGGGPRVCIGINLATMELVLALATMAQRFRVELRERKPVEMRALLTMEPKHGRLRVGAVARDSARDAESKLGTSSNTEPSPLGAE
jgi:cytochrome P450